MEAEIFSFSTHDFTPFLGYSENHFCFRLCACYGDKSHCGCILLIKQHLKGRFSQSMSTKYYETPKLITPCNSSEFTFSSERSHLETPGIKPITFFLFPPWIFWSNNFLSINCKFICYFNAIRHYLVTAWEIFW